MAVIATFVKDADAVLDYTIHWGAADWLTATAYNPDDRVRDPYDGKFYRCIAQNTSGTTRRGDAASWSLIKNGLWLKAGDTLLTSTWVNVPTGITVDTDTNDSYTATVWISGGTVGESYEMTNRITSNNSPNRADDRTVKFSVKSL